MGKKEEKGEKEEKQDKEGGEWGRRRRRGRRRVRVDEGDEAHCITHATPHSVGNFHRHARLLASPTAADSHSILPWNSQRFCGGGAVLLHRPRHGRQRRVVVQDQRPA